MKSCDPFVLIAKVCFEDEKLLAHYILNIMENFTCTFYFKARNIMKGDPFTLICSVMVDFSTIVDLTWSTPNPRAIADHRLSQPDTVHRNLSWPGTHLKLVEQVINILHFGIGILCSRHQHGRHAPFEIGVTAELMTLFWVLYL